MANVRLEEGTTAPAFTLPDQDGNHVSLSDFAGKSVIVYFYPAAMTPGCTTQACDFRDSLSSLQKLKKFQEHDGLTIPLLSDPDFTVHNAYGAYGEKSMYGKTVMGTIRSTFVVGPDGKLTHALYNVKATGHVAMLRTKLGL